MNIRKKKLLWIVFGSIAVASLIVIVAVLTWGKISDNKYQPIEEFKAAYESLKSHNVTSYDLEKTVQVITAIEVAQHDVQDFNSFLEYLSKQDYEGVAPDVLKAKQKMLPVLQDIYLLQKEYDGLNLWTVLVSHLSSDPSTESTGLFSGHGINGLLGVKNAASYVFDKYREEQELKGLLKKKIKKIQGEYIDYLAEFTPIYIKYMKEWDRLCINKDRAYINLYNNHPDEVIKDCDKILSSYPTNREALLLKAYGHVLCSRDESANAIFLNVENEQSSFIDSNQHIIKAQATLDKYMELYSSQAAPALVVQGMLYDYCGQHEKAVAYYDQASVEFPRQAEYLTDMLNCYRIRTYLNGTREGLYLLNLYRATMEGIGFFSPNLIKASFYDAVGDYEECSKEIYNHFFRRSNQSVYDELLTDITVCEHFMPNSFNRLLPERNYIDVEIAKKGKLLGLTSDPSAIDIRVTNRSDIDLENLRVFLCLHFTDMYVDNYHIQKLPTFNRIQSHSYACVNGVEITYPGKDFNDIANARAIAMTNNRICWVDNVYNVSDNIDYNKAHSFNPELTSNTLGLCDKRTRDQYLASINKSVELYKHSIETYTRISIVTKSGNLLQKPKQQIQIELPRELLLISPTFTLNAEQVPQENYIKGGFIHLTFDLPNTAWQQVLLYITSPYVSYKVLITNNGDIKTISAIDVLEE